MLSTSMEIYQKNFYVAHNATFKTAVAINATPTAIAATEGMLSIYNSASRTGSTNRNVLVVPLYIKLVCGTIAASGTDFSTRVAVDVIDRYSTGGAALTVSSCFVDTLSSWTRETAVSTVKFGDLTLAAASSEKQVGQQQWHGSGISQTAGDQFLLTFGEFQGASALISSTAVQQFYQVCTPVILAPGTSMIMQPFETAATGAATFEVEIGIVEIKHSNT